MGLVLRLGAGEPYLSLDPIIRYPFHDEDLGQLFPFRTFAMLVSFTCIVLVSKLMDIVFVKLRISRAFDVLSCFEPDLAETKKGGATGNGFPGNQVVPQMALSVGVYTPKPDGDFSQRF